MIGEQSIGQDLEGSVCGLIEVLSQRGLRKATENYKQDSWCRGRQLNRAPPTYNATALPLRQFERYVANDISHFTVSNVSTFSIRTTIIS
jgi:hypothetical protein